MEEDQKDIPPTISECGSKREIHAFLFHVLAEEECCEVKTPKSKTKCDCRSSFVNADIEGDVIKTLAKYARSDKISQQELVAQSLEESDNYKKSQQYQRLSRCVIVPGSATGARICKGKFSRITGFSWRQLDKARAVQFSKTTTTARKRLKEWPKKKRTVASKFKFEVGSHILITSGLPPAVQKLPQLKKSILKRIRKTEVLNREPQQGVRDDRGRRRKPPQGYNPGHEVELCKKFPDIHLYTEEQYYNKLALQKMYPNEKLSDTFKIKNLGNGKHGVELKDCIPIADDTNPIYKVMDDTLKCIRENSSFVNAAILAMPEADQSKWSAIIDKEEHLKDVTHFLAKDPSLKDPFQNTLQAGIIHHQDKYQDKISYYPQHVDTIKSVVLFYQLAGLSYNLIAVPGPSSEATWETGKSSYSQYDTYKKKLEKKTLKKVQQAEEDLFKLARSKHYTSIQVYKLTEGSRLAFAAGWYPHMTIIPARADQPGHTQRVLLVCHELAQQSK